MLENESSDDEMYSKPLNVLDFWSENRRHLYMKFTIEVSAYPRDKYLCLLSYGSKRRVIKTDELTDIVNALNVFSNETESGELSDIAISTEVDKKYEFILSEAQCKRLINIIETQNVRTRIELPTDLAQSHEKLDLVYSYRDLTKYKDYWKKNPSSLPLLLKQLSEDIIETPYADRPIDYIYRFAKFAFHVNHGSGHGLRQLVLMEALVNYISIHSPEVSSLSRALKGINKEELACLKLAMFLFRSGRTNETGWSSDRKYSPRSAFIFSSIALALGFDEEMINVISRCFDFKADIVLEKTFLHLNLEEGKIRARLYQRLFRLVHTIELSRCFSDQESLKEEFANLLDGFFSPEAGWELRERMFDLEATFLQATGSLNAGKVVASKGKEGSENPYLQVRTVSELTLSYSELQATVQSKPYFMVPESGNINESEIDNPEELEDCLNQACK